MATGSPENKQIQPLNPAYIGRFAPSPTGPLHLGSMVAAVGSFLQARSRNGLWKVRVEDIDPPREVPGAARSQLATLDAFGMKPDGSVIWQSASKPFHDKALDTLLAENLAFHCACSRRDLPASGVYPGICRNGIAEGRKARSIRAKVTNEPIAFADQIQGPFEQNLADQCGDFIIRRADSLIAYQLAVVVDDARDGITEIVRGADLLDSTPRQIHLQQCLGLATPAYLHLPLVIGADGRKLSKSEFADPVNRLAPVDALVRILRILGHPPPPGPARLDRLWRWAIENWQPEAIPKGPVGVHAD